MNSGWMGSVAEIKQVLYPLLLLRSICISYCFDVQLFVVTPRFNEIFALESG
jgi:hypothetical protein